MRKGCTLSPKYSTVLLARLPADRHMSEAVLNNIRDGSAKRARQEVRQQSPQLKTLIEEEMARWND